MFEILNKKTVRFFIALVALAAFIYFFYLLSNIFVLVALSVLLGFIFAPLVRLLEGKGFSRTLSTLLVFIAFGFFVYLSLSFVIPKFYYQMDQVIFELKGFSLNEQLNAS